MELELLLGRYALCRLPVGSDLPKWLKGAFYSVTVTLTEVSIICEAAWVPEGVPHEPGWRCFIVKGTLDYSLTGILSSFAAPLAVAGVSLFALSTFDTNYLLVTNDCLEEAVTALTTAGHTVRKAA